MPRAQCGHHCQASHGIEPGADDPTMNPVVDKVPDHFTPHVNAPGRTLRPDRGDLEAQHVIEDDPFFEDGSELSYELGFELFG